MSLFILRNVFFSNILFDLEKLNCASPSTDINAMALPVVIKCRLVIFRCLSHQHRQQQIDIIINQVIFIPHSWMADCVCVCVWVSEHRGLWGSLFFENIKPWLRNERCYIVNFCQKFYSFECCGFFFRLSFSILIISSNRINSFSYAENNFFIMIVFEIFDLKNLHNIIRLNKAKRWWWWKENKNKKTVYRPWICDC